MKGIILAGGTGSRLYPNTIVTSKQLLPVYDKPMVYYPLSTLMFAGIREVLIISTQKDINLYKKIFGNGHKLGMSFSYKEQEKPNGIAEAFILGEEFIGSSSVCLILGDNLFYGDGLSKVLREGGELNEGALIFGYWVKEPERYGIVEFNDKMNVVSLEEKPISPRSNYAVPGLYYYDNTIVEIAKEIKPSSRNELEITDVNLEYLKRRQLKVQLFGRGTAWLDAGTPEGLLESSNFISTIEKRQGLKIACIEEVAFRMKYINEFQLSELIDEIPNCEYKEYLEGLI